MTGEDPYATVSGDAQLGSKWARLSPHLIARFFEVERTSSGNWMRVRNSAAVAAPLNESTSLEVALNWQSQFEQYGAESKAPAITAHAAVRRNSTAGGLHRRADG